MEDGGMTLEILEEVAESFNSNARRHDAPLPGAELRALRPEMIQRFWGHKFRGDNAEKKKQDERRAAEFAKEETYREMLLQDFAVARGEDPAEAYLLSGDEERAELLRELLRTTLPPQAQPMDETQWPDKWPDTFSMRTARAAARLYGTVGFGALSDTERVRHRPPAGVTRYALPSTYAS